MRLRSDSGSADKGKKATPERQAGSKSMICLEFTAGQSRARVVTNRNRGREIRPFRGQSGGVMAGGPASRPAIWMRGAALATALAFGLSLLAAPVAQAQPHAASHPPGRPPT